MEPVCVFLLLFMFFLTSISEINQKYTGYLLSGNRIYSVAWRTDTGVTCASSTTNPALAEYYQLDSPCILLMAYQLQLVLNDVSSPPWFPSSSFFDTLQQVVFSWGIKNSNFPTFMYKLNSAVKTTTGPPASSAYQPDVIPSTT